MKARRGVFGGTAGLWLLQKKYQQWGAAYHDRRVSCTGTSVRDNDESFSASTNSGASRVGWDDEQCRPVYDDLPTSSTHASPSNNSEEHDDDAALASPPSVMKKSSDASRKQMVTMTEKSSYCNGRRGVFGTRKRHYFVPIPESCGSITSSDNDSFTNSSRLDDRQYKRIRLELSSSLSSSNQTSESGNSKGFKRDAAESFVVAVRNDTSNSEDDNKIGWNFNAVSSKLSQKSLSSSSSVFDFDKSQKQLKPTEIRQPGCQTSVDVARDFFAELDADQTLLTLEDESSRYEPSSGRKQSIVKTSRNKLPPKVAHSEYSKYCVVCRESDVKPLPKICFLEQRSTYFRTGDVFDGMFDG